jgi:hypothetical protein
MSWRDDYIMWLRRFDVDLEIRSGWLKQSAGRGDWIGGEPCGQVNHHFVNSYSSADAGLVSMLERGYSGGPSPYIVNEFLGRDGKLFLISSYPTGHPGKGSRAVLNRVMAGLAPQGDAAALGLPNDLPQPEAERRYYGVEVSNPGDGTPLRPGQYETLVARNAALALALGISPNASIQHREHTDRKSDIHPKAVNANELRSDVRKLILTTENLPAGIKPPVVVEKEWFEMPLDTVAQNQLIKLFQDVLSDPNILNMQAVSELSHDTGVGKSLAGVLADLTASQQRLELAVTSLSDKVEELGKASQPR